MENQFYIRSADLEITKLYEENGLFAKIIDAPAEETFHNGFHLKGQITHKAVTFADDVLEQLRAEETMVTALKWARLFGGSLVVMLINDGGGLEEPLRMANIRSVDGLIVYDRSIIRHDCSGFGGGGDIPEHFHIYSRHGTFSVHKSRCLLFRNGSKLHEHSKEMHLWPWGIPEAYRILPALQEAEASHGAAVRLLDKAIQPVQKISNLSQILAAEGGVNHITRRMEVADLAKGLLNTMVMDMEDDFRYLCVIPEGVREIVNISDQMLSTVTGIPEIVLLGKPVDYEHPGQLLRNHDAVSLGNWYNLVERIQASIKGNLWRLLSICFRAGVNTGELSQLPHFDLEFLPLWTTDEMEQASVQLARVNRQLAQAKTAEGYIRMGVIKPAEVRKGLYRKRMINRPRTKE